MQRWSSLGGRTPPLYKEYGKPIVVKYTSIPSAWADGKRNNEGDAIE